MALKTFNPTSPGRRQLVLVDRSADHVFAPGFVAVMFGEAGPDAFRRPLRDLLDPKLSRRR